MAQYLIRIASRIDLPLIVILSALSVIGLGTLYSAGGENVDLLISQTVRLSVGVVIMLGIASVPSNTIYRYSPHVYLAGLALLVMVLTVGTGKGAERWLDLGFVRFQPAELMKLAVPMVVAWLLTQPAGYRRRLYVIVSGICVLLPTWLIYMQPDLGTALLIVAVGACAIFLGGLAWKWIALISATAIAAVPLIWPLLHQYQRDRVLTMFNPWADPFGSGYHSIQSMIAIGSGGLFGKGWLNGSQSRLEFIPEPTTDFVFAVFAEEFGLFGATLLFVLYLCLVIRCLAIAYRTKHDYARILAGSIGIMLFVHLFVNVGMVTGILPVVGLPLPMISFGGTSMVTVLAGIGIVMGARHVQT